MSLDLFKIVEIKYTQAGFVCVKKDDNCEIFKNKFSIHYVFYCDSLNKAKETIPKFLKYLGNDYLKTELITDLYWNFYAIFLIETKTPDSEFTKVKENVEKDFRICRKYVLSDENIESLPPSFIEIGSKPDISDSVWEQEWRQMVGATLYDEIMKTSKSHIGKVFEKYINDKTN